MIHDSFYRQLLASPRVNKGHDYATGGLLSRFLSPRMYGNPMLSGFLQKLDKMLIETTEAVKYLQFHFNWVIDKGDRSLNI